ncbi:MAG: hypothetical protein JWQ90_3325 [Hydrocarboniphaga sp.]|nr:hypothetical protein [Hydrocarboniphaga sp.]
MRMPKSLSGGCNEQPVIIVINWIQPELDLNPKPAES